MPNNLVIVESPAKAKTIQKFLGKDFKVMSSYGHIRDLHSKDFSIDVENGFQPIYEIPDNKQTVVNDLRKEAKKADLVWLASDEDREGEAIAWHLYDVLGLKPENTRRIVFHEITKPAILKAIENPRDIDRNLVDAQQARRVLDRIVGFELSPVLWKKIKPSLSAGRVQSVAVRLLAEREKEIKDFKTEVYYRLTAQFSPQDSDTLMPAELSTSLRQREQAMAFLEDCKTASFEVADVTVKPLKKSPAPPFTTSTLQQEASRKLGFSVSQTMRVAQSLYESGYITYMRTDSVNLSSLALSTISAEIKQQKGEKYLKVRQYHTTSKGAQEAHEAIRPTFISNHDINGTVQEKKLYNLIWKRTIASQMADAELEKTSIDVSISNRPEHFTASAEVIKFDGFLSVYIESSDDEKNDTQILANALPQMPVGTKLTAAEVTATQRYTQQPMRYTEASLVRRLESLGIGRPSTYAPTISTIQAREYVTKGESKGEKRDFEVITLKKNKVTSKTKSEVVGGEKGKLIPTDVGMVVNDFLMKYFPSIMDYNFTAKVEEEFDDIADGKKQWNSEISSFYKDFHPNIERVASLRLEHKVGERVLGTDPKTGKTVSVKIGRFGPLVQLGSTDEAEKPRFASLLKDQSVASITLDEALKLFELPRTLGTFEGVDVVVAVGRFGPYVKHGSKFVSIPASISPQELTLEQAQELIVEKRQSEAQKLIKSFDEDPAMQVLNGRYGAYISYNKQNYKIPAKYVAQELTLEQCREIVADEANASKKSARGKASKGAAKTTAKKAAAKKTAKAK
ncbi:MAG: type I DNA topoisomerase [Muribaculaceae bacterium]|nr:type I DNA topoisomerase [Muribaculaceae bacterium]